MIRALKLMLLVCAFTLSAQPRALKIAGGVYEDRMALAVRPHFLAAEGVTVRLYRDDRTAVATTRTNHAGLYIFTVAGPGSYIVTVDSHTFHPQGWPEQTFGPAGAHCAHPERGTTITLYEGPCFGGRTLAGSDDATTLATAEHIAQVTVAGESVTNVDFAFSFGAVVTTADSGQGSLRQYFMNANAVRGPNRMRFVPIARGTEHNETPLGVEPGWWTIQLASPLPELIDDDTVVDGIAYNFLSPGTLADPNPGRFGEPVTMQSGERQLSRLRKPELEVIGGGTSSIVCTTRCGLRGLAVHGTATSIITRADARMEHVLVGSDPTGKPVYDGGVTGVQAERGTLVARHLLVTAQSSAGIAVSREARLDGDHLDVSHCGEAVRGAGIVLTSAGSSIRSSVITMNPGAGIALGSTDGSAPATNNLIDGTTISGNQAGVVIGPGSSRNVITRNDIMWNRLGGVTVAPAENLTQPRENRISANRFDENGLRPIILDLDVDDPHTLHPGADTCARTPILPAPRVTYVKVEETNGLRAVIRGRACPGQIVELYQSFVTSSVREKAAAMPHVRNGKTNQETLNSQGRTLALPSIGEFNYLGATNTTPEGTFEATFPLPVVTSAPDDAKTFEETDIWATQVLTSAKPSDRAFSAISIDAAGNTSEMSVRRKAD
ncbi:MAG TPA: right-handed parallel beta-helix repeat-containing protein [Thermoanaerobaculia bacterium]|nr:right-handed parallel beta-helix repeat-containing protein [Thermoanaerobaculia bacterium]